MMPGMDGYEVARSLHRRPETALIPILMFTARTQPEDKVAGYDVGVDLYLTKPVHPLDLQANIRALLLQRKSRKEASANRGYLVGVFSGQGRIWRLHNGIEPGGSDDMPTEIKNDCRGVEAGSGHLE